MKNKKINSEEASNREELSKAENTDKEELSEGSEAEIKEADKESAEENSRGQSEEKAEKKAEDKAEKKSSEKTRKKPLTAAKQGKKKRFKHGALSVVLTVIFVAAIVLLNIIFNMVLDRFDIAADLTDNSIYSIQDSTASYIAGLDDSITVIVASDEAVFKNKSTSDGAQYGKQVSEIISRFTAAGNSVKAEYRGLENNPAFFSKYGNDLTANDIIVESAGTGRYVVLNVSDYLDPKYYFNGQEVSPQEYSQYYMYYGGYGSYFSIEYNAAVEKCLLSAIMNVSDRNPVKAAVITEDYGATAPSSLINLLEANTFTVEEIKLSTIESISEDYDFVILNAPLYDLTDNDLNKLDKWLDNGGRLGKNLFYSASATADTLPNLYAFLSEWGIEVQSGYVYQTNTDYGYQMSPTYQQLEIKDTDYSENVDTATKAAYGDGLKAVKRLFEESGAYKTAAIVSTYEGAVIAPFDSLQDFDPSTAGQSGSYDIIAESNKVVFEGVNGTYSRVYVLGSELLLESAFLESQYANNSDIILNIFTTAAGKDKVEVDVTPKSYSLPAMEITGAQMQGITVVFAVIVPLLVIVTGVVIIVRRKRR